MAYYFTLLKTKVLFTTIVLTDELVQDWTSITKSTNQPLYF